MLNLSTSITKRKDGRYMGRFIIGHDKNQKPQYQYVYGETYEEAEKRLIIGKEIELRYLSGKNITVAEVYQEWLNSVANRVKESTYANYKVKFEKHILPEFSNTLCCDLSAGKINEFINVKLDEGLSAGYVKDIFTVFKSMLKYAQEEYDFKISLKNVVLPKTEKKKSEKISDTKQKLLVTYLKNHMNLTALGILISLFMGLRIGELCGLKWSDVDFKNKILHIHRTVQRISIENGSKKTKIITSAPKSETSFRSISIPDFLMEYFEKFRNSDDFYILSGSEKVVEPRCMQYRYKKILKAACAGNYNFHKLRHTFATNCIQSGFDTKTLSVILGHSSINMTLTRYVHPDYSYERRLMNSMCMLF